MGGGAPDAGQGSRCTTFRHRRDDDDPSKVDPRSLCDAFEESLLPPVAADAIDCMDRSQWSLCDVSRCVFAALDRVAPGALPQCKTVDAECPANEGACDRYAPGMTPAGRETFMRCLVDKCGFGVRVCLWNRSVSACRSP